MKNIFHSNCCGDSDNGDINLPNRSTDPLYRPGDRVMVKEATPGRVLSVGEKKRGQMINDSSRVDIRFTYRVKLANGKERKIYEPHLRVANDNDAGPFPNMP
ncbi:hypothetical protein BofuT4_P083410.1 [Botrytis cinerea T4]|uniref:Uncharacterized protein n=1 Tax=Botryotinia fuckeliana (strain T4) TaxID=999810 RepID=G2YJZ0_BOTF4|nr:hypothetical protein BofuT4_P083410.1 [Botrytis cinerea T4]